MILLTPTCGISPILLRASCERRDQAPELAEHSLCFFACALSFSVAGVLGVTCRIVSDLPCSQFPSPSLLGLFFSFYFLSLTTLLVHVLDLFALCATIYPNSHHTISLI